MSISPMSTGGRALVLAMLLATGVASEAQSTGDDAEPTTRSAETLDLTVKGKPRPRDDVGGSWNWFVAAGRMTNGSLVHDLYFDYGGWQDTYLISGEVGYTMKNDNAFTRFFEPVVSNIEGVMNVTYQDETNQNVIEFNPYMMFRWSNFPWNKTIRTTFGLGGGFSYATPIPEIEKNPNDAEGHYNNLMHFIAVEATFALPQHDDWQLVYRLHHRSGIFGLLQADNEGNTAVEIGLRHYFK
jgi:hypothetical protein